MDEKNIQMLDIASDFSPTPGGRYKKHGAFSGEVFRDTVLAPRLKAAATTGAVVRVRIDTVDRAYLSSFLDESFGGLVRECGFDADYLKRHLEIVSNVPRFEKYRLASLRYIEEASRELAHAAVH